MAPISEIVWVFILIVVIFYVTLILKSLFKVSICSICLAVSSSWLLLLAARGLGWFENSALLAMLLGMSVVGGFYLWERRASKNMLIYRLPVLLTLAFLAWSAVTLEINMVLALVVVAIWLLHSLIYLYRNNPNIKPKVDKIIACCSSW